MGFLAVLKKAAQVLTIFDDLEAQLINSWVLMHMYVRVRSVVWKDMRR